MTPHAHCAPVTPVLGERHPSSLAGIAPPVEFSSWENSSRSVPLRDPVEQPTKLEMTVGLRAGSLHQRASSFSISESQRKSLPGAMIWATSRSVAIELCIVVDATRSFRSARKAPTLSGVTFAAGAPSDWSRPRRRRKPRKHAYRSA